jgi:hypothetical protein
MSNTNSGWWMLGTLILAGLIGIMLLGLVSPEAARGLSSLVVMLLLIAVSIFLYFLPSIIAVVRHHHQVGSIILINVFLGWTFLGWVVALAISASAVKK